MMLLFSILLFLEIFPANTLYYNQFFLAGAIFTGALYGFIVFPKKIDPIDFKWF
jgi:hypothetical protein